eukprot:TRINITY_DN5068_c0_g2_i1.p1 TRINITY_DN5068_c0_g2~~TRINITY_DN5068_c0_g2_i1.p1  ORF type:complete len:197 (+),score=28.80 TRINITY_DN5068_c0_g2_i1:756-1346(+)
MLISMVTVVFVKLDTLMSMDNAKFLTLLFLSQLSLPILELKHAQEILDPIAKMEDQQEILEILAQLAQPVILETLDQQVILETLEILETLVQPDQQETQVTLDQPDQQELDQLELDQHLPLFVNPTHTTMDLEFVFVTVDFSEIKEDHAYLDNLVVPMKSDQLQDNVNVLKVSPIIVEFALNAPLDHSIAQLLKDV